MEQKQTRVMRYKCILVKEESHLYNIQRKLNSDLAIYHYAKEVFKLEQAAEEHFIAIYLDAKMCAIGYQEIAVGSLTAAIVHPREVYKGAILANAYALIVLHNHPSSGNSEPSENDIEITRRLKEAGEILGIKLLEHIIIGDNKYTTLSDKEYGIF